MTDGDKLRALADWFDVRDAKRGLHDDEVQQDLRRIAQNVDLWVPTVRSECGSVPSTEQSSG